MFRCFGYFWLLIGFTDSDVTIPSDSNPYGLLVICEPSDAISTPLMSPLLIPYLPLPFKKRNTLYHFNLTQTAFPCVIRPFPLNIDLDTLHSTSFYCILLIILCFSSYFIIFAPISLNLSFPTLDCVYEPPHSFTYHYPISIEPDITPLHPFYIVHLPQELIYQDFRNL